MKVSWCLGKNTSVKMMRILNSSNSNSNNRKKKWLRSGAVGLVLLLIPRRSSLKADSKLVDNAENEVNNKVV